MSREIPLFPLSTVLFPGGRLDLRIFEPRYLDMVRECTRNGTGFGVCLILAGREVGTRAVPAPVGTLARIVDFSSTDDGLLAIVARGGSIFHVEGTRVREDGLMLGEVRDADAEPSIPVPAEYGLLATILERVAEQLGGELDRADRASFDDAAWVSYRLAEILPLDAEERQQLLATPRAVDRLERLAEWLPRFQRA